MLLTAVAAVLTVAATALYLKRSGDLYTGSKSCRPCHERFYKLWASSHHGRAMQPYTDEFARLNLAVHQQPLQIGTNTYEAKTAPKQGYIVAKSDHGTHKYDIAHVMGGKNVYYFLTPLERGKLQVLPLAYDVHKNMWFDTAASAVRHFTGNPQAEALPWTDPMYTFNTSCHGCHVSRLSTNYDPETDSYRTTWSEPGINCETCHGPGRAHIKACAAASEDNPPNNLEIISTDEMDHRQINAMCAACHAKLSPVSPSFSVGDLYYDHFDLITLEHPDYYPDGRDLGENYTYTSWRMSPCVQSGQLDCVHCHTSSGRYKFAQAEKANEACLPCHEKRVENAPAHTHHEPNSPGNKCIACHMPKTEFARMARSDHSMRPPAPAATIKYNSPNACNICHSDQTPEWAHEQVRQWHASDYQKTILDQADLVDAAGKGDWSRIDLIIAYLTGPDRDEITATSLIRLISDCPSDKHWPVLTGLLEEDPSPLVRSAAAHALQNNLGPEAVTPLLNATTDEYRLVRVRAASSLAPLDKDLLGPEQRKNLQVATDELLAGLRARPDDYASHYNLGNYHAAAGAPTAAIAAYQKAIRLRPDYLASHVNIAFAYNALGRNSEAEASFRKALAIDPNSTPARINLAMLLAEQGQLENAKTQFEKVAQIDPNSAVAAYNLAVLNTDDNPEKALAWSQRAFQLDPANSKYRYTYAYYLADAGKKNEAIEVLAPMPNSRPPYLDGVLLLARLHLQQQNPARAAQVYRTALKNTPANSEQYRILSARLRSFNAD